MDCTPKEIAEIAIKKGMEKVRMSLSTKFILGFLGGAFIAIGFLACIRMSGTVPEEWGSFATFLGASVFPLGLILVVLGGGELVTGNMMMVSIAYLARKVKLIQLVQNWILISVFNLMGAVFVAYYFGHFIGLTEGEFLEKTIHTASGKIEASFWEAFVSGIGCNWLVSMAIWLSLGAKSFSGKIIAIWFPIMGFVLIGFQHLVANMFIIPAAIFAGELSWTTFLPNIIPVFLGNAVGATVFVSLFYYIALYKDAEHESHNNNIDNL